MFFLLADIPAHSDSLHASVRGLGETKISPRPSRIRLAGEIFLRQIRAHFELSTRSIYRCPSQDHLMTFIGSSIAHYVICLLHW